jgi:hypothetical protein
VTDSPDQYAASLRVATRRTCADVSRALGLSPDEVHAKGERMSPRNPVSAVYQRDLWLLRSGLPDEAPLESHLRALLDRVDPVAVRSLADDSEIDVFCLVDARRTTLSAAVLGEVAALPATLVLDVYPPESGGTGKTTAVTFTTAAGDVTETDLAGVATHRTFAPDGRWDVTFTSDNGQGSIELDPASLERLAAIGAPLTVWLGPRESGNDWP